MPIYLILETKYVDTAYGTENNLILHLSNSFNIQGIF